MICKDFWIDKKVLVTGHTGFKGAWLTLWLQQLGANLFGISNESFGSNSMYELCNISGNLKNGKLNISDRGDITRHDEICEVIKKINPHVIFHLAAQPLVLKSYQSPQDTYLANVLGTLNVLEAARDCTDLRVVISVTTDKVYENTELTKVAFREEHPLGGYDPYSASKACADILSQSHYNVFLKKNGVELATVRAGNVIGGGDWAANRLVPDLIRSAIKNEKLVLRYPNAVRPWQYVLDPIRGYIILAQYLANSANIEDTRFNFGPTLDVQITVLELVKQLCNEINLPFSCEIKSAYSHHEANYLNLNSEKAQKLLGWESILTSHLAISHTANWYKCWMEGRDVHEISIKSIEKMTI